MLSKTWFALPLAVKLSEIYLDEDTLLYGDLQDEYAKLIRPYIRFTKNKKLKATISKTFLCGTSLWSVTYDILERFHLLPVVLVDSDGALVVKFEKSQAWSRSGS